MSILTLTAPRNPDVGSGYSAEFMSESVRFGDGYVQDTAFGLNTQKVALRLTWGSLTQDERDDLVDFFNERGGWQYFYYTLPTESTPRVWLCKKFDESWTETIQYTISATFEERFVFTGS